MKIFNEEEVENHINDVCKFRRRNLSETTDVFMSNEVEAYKKACFKVGVECAERKIEDLCVEFATFIENNFITAISSGKKYIDFHKEDDSDFTSDSNRYSLEEVFQQFLKERNNEKA